MSSNQSIAYPNIALNVAVTESLDFMATELEKAIKGGKSLEQAVGALLPKVIKEHKRIIFNGNNYSKEWEKEAGKRGLLNQKNTVDALPNLIAKEVIGVFEKYKVLTGRELHARYEVMVETYNKTVNVEGQLMVLMANRYILPAAFDYQTRVAKSVVGGEGGGRQVGGGEEGPRPGDDADRRAQAAHGQAREGAGPREQRIGRQAREALSGQRHPGDGARCATRLMRSKASSRTTRGRSPRIARCSSSSRGQEGREGQEASA